MYIHMYMYVYTYVIPGPTTLVILTIIRVHKYVNDYVILVLSYLVLYSYVLPGPLFK